MIDQYIQHLSQLFISQNAVQLAQAIPLDPSHPLWSALKATLSSIVPETINPFVRSVPAESRKVFAQFVVDLFKFIKAEDEVVKGRRIQETGVHANFSRLRRTCESANDLYALQSGNGSVVVNNGSVHVNAFLNTLMIRMSKALCEAGAESSHHYIQAQDLNGSRNEFDRVRQTIERTFSIASSPIAPERWAEVSRQQYIVSDNIWAIANVLWRLYRTRLLTSQSERLDRNILALSPSEDERIRTRAPALDTRDICEAYYWRGKLQVKLLNFRLAKGWMDKAWDVCPVEAYNQRRAILLRLVPVNLLVGLLPNRNLISTYNLHALTPLLTAFQTGNIPAWRSELDKNREFYRRHGTWLVLFERGETLVWRNLFRRAWKEYGVKNPIAVGKSQCPLWVVIEATKRCFEGTGEIEDGKVGLADVICALAMLIEHGLLLGYVGHRNETLVMKKAENGMGGWPVLATVVPRETKMREGR